MELKNEKVLQNLGRAIETQRRAAKLTQAALAELAGVGPNYIRHLEAGKTTAHISKVLDVLSALGLQLKLEFGKEKIDVNIIIELSK